MFGDFHPTQEDFINIEKEETKLEINNIMDLVEESIQAFETEALNIEPIYIANVDTFLKKYKTHFFRTKKSMKIVKEQIKYAKHIKKELKCDIKKLMIELKQKQKQEQKIKN